ncbi:MAG: zinc metallopeptidase [Betaproteobacteria bacterium]|nr:zinc metallopeptidase [Betaproteobacteria bacterium]
MKLDDERESSNFEDRRGGGGVRGKGGLGIGAVVVILIVSYFLDINPSTLMGVAEQVQSGAPSQAARPLDPANDPQREMVSELRKVLSKTEDTWQKIFEAGGAQYREPKLVVFTGSTPTACGTGDTASGPFYCPADEKMYLDLAFFTELERRYRAAGDFARAYVIAHEVGHHVQKLTGVSQKTAKLRQQLSAKDYNKVSVRVELQADCYAGVWAHHAHKAKPFIEPGDIEEALRAATAIGDDALQRAASGRVVPDSFTHGSSEQRVRWFKTGFEGGSLKACDTFSAGSV